MKPILINDDNGRALVIEAESEGALVSKMKDLGYVRAFISGEPFGLKLENGILKKFKAHPWFYRKDEGLLKIGTRIMWNKQMKGLLIPYSLPKSGVIIRVNKFNTSYDVEDENGYVHCSVPANEVCSSQSLRP